MSQPTFSLSWESHRNNICDGLSSLQQNGEFVDMTLAADGHHVKVHQMIMALSSPFIKELIRSASCPHPVIFLNKLSYTTLSSILEYIYTGEVVVSVENLSELIQAARELHIKGLEDMNETIRTSGDADLSQVRENIKSVDAEFLHLRGARDIQIIPGPNQTLNTQVSQQPPINTGIKRKKAGISEMDDDTFFDHGYTIDESHADNSSDGIYENDDRSITVLDKQPKKLQAKQTSEPLRPPGTMIQYTLSCQGSIQIVVNRYIYYMRYTKKNSTRMWRCQEYFKKKCRAFVITRGDLIVERGNAHNHPFHDRQILKKVRNGNMFTGFNNAEIMSSQKKQKVETAGSDHDDNDEVNK